MTDNKVFFEQITELLDNKKRDQAVILNENFWSYSEELNNNDKKTYADVLLNMGEIERAGILLKEILYTPYDYLDLGEIIVKYSLLAPDLVGLKQLGEINEIYQKNSELFDWVRKVVEERTVLEYSLLIKNMQKILKNKLLHFNYKISNEVLEADFYTTDEKSSNEAVTKKLTREITKQFYKRGLTVPDKMNLNIFTDKFSRD